MRTPSELLTDEFQRRRSRNDQFSLRAFARWLQISPAQLSQMMSGKRTVTAKTIRKISGKLDLSPVEQRRLLRTSAPLQAAEPTQVVALQEDQFRLISEWYHLAILSLTRLPNAKPDPRWIGRRLGISAAEANLALQRLQRMNLIELHPRFRQIGDPFQVSSETSKESIRSYHKQILNLAQEKLELVDVQNREYQSISLPVNPKLVKKFRALADQFMDDARELAESAPAQEIYCLNIQFFPVTKVNEENV